MTLKRTVFWIGVAAITALVIFNFVIDRIPIGDPHWREDGTYRAQTMK